MAQRDEGLRAGTGIIRTQSPVRHELPPCMLLLRPWAMSAYGLQFFSPYVVIPLGFCPVLQ